MSQIIHRSIFIAGLLLLPVLAFAKPQLQISVVAEKEVTVTEQGQKVKRLVKAEKIAPDEVLTYTVTYRNVGNEVAKNAVISNPIPQGTVYLPDSATGAGSDITFSIDGGKSFKKPSLLTYEVKLPSGKNERLVASPEVYTTIRWVVPSIPAGQGGTLGFKVRVK